MAKGSQAIDKIEVGDAVKKEDEEMDGADTECHRGDDKVDRS